MIAIDLPSVGDPRWYQDWRSPVLDGTTKTWHLKVFAGYLFPDPQIRLTGWQLAVSYGPRDTDLDNTLPVKLIVAHDPSYGKPGGYAPGTVLWEVNPDVNGTVNSPNFTVLLNACLLTNPIYLDLVAGPPTMPEPCSLLALASGVVGLCLGALRKSR